MMDDSTSLLQWSHSTGEVYYRCSNMWHSYERSQPKRVGGKLELDAISMLSAKVDAMSQRLERSNVNYISSGTLLHHVKYVGLLTI